MTFEPMFSGPLGFLSNFDTTPFHMPALGTVVASNEHAFNALKTIDPTQRAWVLDAATPAVAKRRGNDRTGRITLRPDWNYGARVRAMQSGLLAKFALPDLARALADTATLHLVETNTWHDQFWGSCQCPRHKDVPGINMLGELLMALRSRHL